MKLPRSLVLGLQALVLVFLIVLAMVLGMSAWPPDVGPTPLNRLRQVTHPRPVPSAGVER